MELDWPRAQKGEECMTAWWQPEGKRNVGRPKTTWRRTVEKGSRQERRTSWAEVRGAAQDKAGWRDLQPYAPRGVERTN